MAVQKGSGGSLAEGCHNAGPERQVGHRVAVHDITVEPVGAAAGHAVRLLPQAGKVGGKEGGGDAGGRHVAVCVQL